MLLRIVLFLCCFQFVYTQTSDTTQVKSSSEKQTQKVILDTVIDGKSQTTKAVSSVSDSLKSSTLEDFKEAEEIDEKWLELLYNNSLFDTIYKSVSELEYEEIYYPELPTDTLKKRLKELNAKTPFNIDYNPSLESVIKGYLKQRRKTIGNLIALSEYYFPMFEEALDKHNLPLEIKYLAIVESALNPTARSRVGAKGLWQFMFTTGKLFGLEVNSYVDERTDPLMATEAACLYLKS